MQPLDCVLRAIDLLEERLRAPVQVIEAAQAAGYSLFHFCRVFNQATGLTPFEYLMRRRLSEAASVLSSSDARVLDVALEFQFGSAEAFARAFKRVFNRQPHLARQHGVDARRCLPRLTFDYLEFLARVRPDPRSAPLGDLYLSGLMTIGTGWGLPAAPLANALQAEAALPPGAPLWAVIRASAGDPSAPPLTFLGFPRADEAAQPGALVGKDLPAASALCLSWPANARDQAYLLAYLHHTWAAHALAEQAPRELRLCGSLDGHGQPHFHTLYWVQ